MRLSVLNKFSSKNFYIDPFPHILIENCIDENIYRELEDSLDIARIKKLGMMRAVYPEHRYKLSEFKDNNYAVNYLWREFMDYHCSSEFVNKALNIFSTYVKDIDFRQYDKENIYTRSNVPDSLPRKDFRKTLVSDCQIVIHDPLDESMTTRTVHVDSPKEIYAGLLYMKRGNDGSAGGDLELYANSGDRTSYIKDSHREVELGSVVKSKVVGYKRNSFVMFLNSAASVHGVSPRVGAETERVSVNIIAERLKSKFFIP